jgi:hypothetical protein
MADEKPLSGPDTATRAQNAPARRPYVPPQVKVEAVADLVRAGGGSQLDGPGQQGFG